MLALASLFAAVVPMVMFLWLVWLMDRYDRAPVGLLILNFAWGAFGAIFFGILFSILTSAVIGSTDFLDTVMFAPIVEELAKGLFLFLTARSRKFDNVTDGLVYGMAIGLGFGMTENFLYFLGASSAGEWVVLVVIRTLFSAVMHAMATGTVGAFIGITKFEYKRMRIPLRLLGFAIAMFMHFLWNFSVSIENITVAGMAMLFILGSVLVILVLLQLSLMYEKKLITRELTEESDAGLLPADHLPYLCRKTAKKKLEWVNMDIDKKKYVRLATMLAFRKAQSRMCNPKDVDSYTAEVEQLRTDIRSILYPGEPPALAFSTPSQPLVGE